MIIAISIHTILDILIWLIVILVSLLIMNRGKQLSLNLSLITIVVLLLTIGLVLFLEQFDTSNIVRTIYFLGIPIALCYLFSKIFQRSY
jgi:hypothetical protein